MDFNALYKRRYSCRSYSNKPVEQDKINTILDAARWAPSSHNSQPWYYIVVNDPVIQKKVYEGIKERNTWAENCPCFLIQLAKKNEVEENHYTRYNLGIAAESISLAAYNEGLGSCILGAINETIIKNIFDIPDEYTVTAVITVGYENDQTKIPRKNRKDLKDFVCYNEWIF